VQEGIFPPDILEKDMDLILIVLVLFLLFGGGGYWGYRRWDNNDLYLLASVEPSHL
jgi:hypothetical protein